MRQLAWIVAVLCAAGLSAAQPSAAVPTPPPPPPPPCSFTMSDPVREGELVSVTVAFTGCAALAAPYSSVACLQTAGAPISCSQAHGADPARVTLPYRAGAYTATGRGCAGWAGLPPHPDCQTLGPLTMTF